MVYTCISDVKFGYHGQPDLFTKVDFGVDMSTRSKYDIGKTLFLTRMIVFKIN
jgi:hypothetical protein